MNTAEIKREPVRHIDPWWRKARIAARLLLKKEEHKLWNARDRALAARLAADPGVTNRLIDQAVYSLKARRKYGVEFWAGSINLETPAGQLLKRLVAALPSDRQFQITIFESAPIQITVDATLTSADVDLFSDAEDLKELVAKAGLDRDHAEFYVQVCSGLNFRTSPHWAEPNQSKLATARSSSLTPLMLRCGIAGKQKAEGRFAHDSFRFSLRSIPYCQ